VNALLRFYRDEGPDDRGRFIHDIWTWDGDRLERTHDYIQWLFPLTEPSGANQAAPLLDAGTIAAFAGEVRLREHLGRSLALMLGFYGYRMARAGEELTVEATPDQSVRQAVWLTPFNHNFLRITRILRSATLLGLGGEARAFHSALAHLYHGSARAVIGARTYDFWTAAVVGPRTAQKRETQEP
jgi:hypothetical protein